MSVEATAATLAVSDVGAVPAPGGAAAAASGKERSREHDIPGRRIGVVALPVLERFGMPGEDELAKGMIEWQARGMRLRQRAIIELGHAVYSTSVAKMRDFMP